VISQTTEYALRIIVYLASLNGEAATTAQIASATQVPQGYLSKVLRNLARGGLVHSQRGLHGGSTLARSPDLMTVLDVVEVVDPIQRIRTCPLGLKSHGVALCPLHRRLDEAMASVEAAFRATTIAEVVAEPSASKPLVDGIPTAPASGLVAARILRRGAKA
jgi:Rrf2 family nitric oxide-sensitive transcriptional repressor